MYTAHFALEHPPFSLVPDPACVYLSVQHREALAHLSYALERGNGGFAAITGEVGTGKTTLSRLLLDDLPKNVRAAYIFNPRLCATELLESICDELGIRPKRRTVKTMTDAITAFLLQAYAGGDTVILVIDEAQGLSNEALEQLRLLTNLETGQDKLLQIILLGQPELTAVLDQHELRQLSQRITLRYHLGPLSRSDTYRYVAHRLQHAGGDPGLFSASAMRGLHAFGRGIPRLTNIAADRALLVAYAGDRAHVNGADVRRAVRELRGSARSFNRAYVFFPSLVISVLLLAWVTIGVMGSPTGWTRVGHAALHPRLPAQDTAADSSAVGLSLALAPAAEQWRAMLALWGLNPTRPPADTKCPRQLPAGLRCTALRVRGWQDLVQVDRPAVLWLIDGRVALARAWQGQVVVGSTKATVIAPEVLSLLWDGTTYVLFSVPVSVPKAFPAGASGPSVAWLSAALDHATKYPAGFRLRDHVDPSMLQQSRALRSRLGMDGAPAIEDVDLLLATAFAGLPPRPSLNIETPGP